MSIKRLLMRAALPLLMLFVTQTLLAQNRVVSGKITDSKDGSPVSGASVQAKGSNQGVSSTADGSFTISVPPNINTLVVSSVGFKELEVDITDKTSVDVSLETTGAALSEVVVVGYGTVRKRDLTGAVVSVKEKDFNKGTFTSPDQLIQGKVAGVQVLNNAGHLVVVQRLRYVVTLLSQVRVNHCMWLTVSLSMAVLRDQVLMLAVSV